MQKHYYSGEKSIYGKNSREGFDVLGNILTAASSIPGFDTFADAAAIPVDLLRGDYISAGLDAFGIIPFVGEIADTAKLARAGINIADAANDAGKVIDAVKIADKADDAADAVKAADDVYSGVSKREKLLSQASNQKLKNAINELYRPGAVTGDGGTADAIRYELKTGAPVGGKLHIQKGYDRLRNLQNILKREELTPREKTIIQELIDDLEKALRGE